VANQKAHFYGGAAASGLVRVTIELHQNPNISLGELFIKTAFSALVGGIGGVLPDFIEPPDNPHHRGAGHSVAMGGLLASALQKIWANPEIDPWFEQLVTDLAIGYGIHLVLDARPPRGLPLLTRNL